LIKHNVSIHLVLSKLFNTYQKCFVQKLFVLFQVIMPTRGSIAFWYNLDRKGYRDLRATHGGCPILKGSKWILNKWIYYYNQVNHHLQINTIYKKLINLCKLFLYKLEPNIFFRHNVAYSEIYFYAYKTFNLNLTTTRSIKCKLVPFKWNTTTF